MQNMSTKLTYLAEVELTPVFVEKSGDRESRCAIRAAAESEPMFALIEQFFFAYRDFVGDADRLLESYKFGRAHHRVLYFVSRRPGMTVTGLLELLRITKQSLNRVLKELLDGGFVEAKTGISDRRQRLLFPTPQGQALALDLARLQTARFARALGVLGPDAELRASAFLRAMTDPQADEAEFGLSDGQGAAS